MRSFILQEMAKPALRRMGTALAAYLIGLGIAADVVDAIQAGFLAASGLGIDLILSHLNRAAK